MHHNAAVTAELTLRIIPPFIISHIFVFLSSIYFHFHYQAYQAMICFLNGFKKKKTHQKIKHTKEKLVFFVI